MNSITEKPMKFSQGKTVWYWKRTGESAWGVVQGVHPAIDGGHCFHEPFYFIDGDDSFHAESDIASTPDELKKLYSQEGSRMSHCLTEAKAITIQHFGSITPDTKKHLIRIAIELFRKD